MCENKHCKLEICDIPYGTCHCGCGEGTNIAPKSNTKNGHIKGEYYLYKFKHQNRTYSVEYIINTETGCWEWQGKTDKLGYAEKRVNNVRIRAHRWYYEQKYGKIPEGLDLDHKCRNPSCCNPDHLEPVTHHENMIRGKVAKLTWDDVKEVRERYLTGEYTYKTLSNFYSVGESEICGIILNKRWVINE